MAHWADRLETAVRRVVDRVRPSLEDALHRGNRRRVVVRDRGGKTVFQTSLTYAVLGAAIVLLIAQPLLPFLLAGVIVAYMLGYRVATVPTDVP